MEKIKSLFQRNYKTDRLIRDEVVLGSEWVLEGSGTATRKFDGTCCMVKNGIFFKRYDYRPKNMKAIRKALKLNKQPPEPIWGEKPSGWIPAEENPNSVTFHWPGWKQVTDAPEDKWHNEAFTGTELNGTYELCGPSINGNPKGCDDHILIPHGYITYPNCPRTFSVLKAWFNHIDIEGTVWHHSDGRMVKIKKKDFGLKR